MVEATVPNKYKNKQVKIMSYQQTQFISRRQQNWSRNQNVTRYKTAVKLGPIAHTVIVALMIAILGLIYLTQATRATSYDYESQKIDSQISELALKKSDLEVENARLSALESIKNSSVAKEMTTPVSVEYVR